MNFNFLLNALFLLFTIDGIGQANLFNAELSSQLGIEDCICPGTGKINSKKYEGKSLKGVDFRNENIDGFSFKGAILEGCTFDGMILKNVSFENTTFGIDKNDVPTSFANATLENVCFKNAFLERVDFQFSTFKSVDFQFSKINFAVFGYDMNIVEGGKCRTNFSLAFLNIHGDITFPLNDITTEEWAFLDFSYTKFWGLTEKNFKPKGKNMSKAILRGISLENFNLDNVNLSNADLRDADFNYSYFNGADLSESKLGHANMQGVIAIGADFQHANLENINLSRANISSAEFNNAILSGSFILNAHANNAKFQNAQFIGKKGQGNLSPSMISNTAFNGADFSSAQINNIFFTDCNLANTTFGGNSGITLSKTDFSRSNLEGADFSKAKLEGLNFTGANLTNANFSDATLEGADDNTPVNFYCAQLGGINLRANIINASFQYALVPVNNTDTSIICCTNDEEIITCGSSQDGTIFQPSQISDLSTEMMCPDGHIAICNEQGWYSPVPLKKCLSIWGDKDVWNRANCSEPVDTSKVVVFADKNLENSIKKQLNLEPNRPILRKYAKTVRSLSCINANISGIKGLEFFTALEYLDLSSNKIKIGDFTKLSKSLETFRIENNQLTQLKFHSSQHSLVILDASHNNIDSTTPLSWFKILEQLDLSNNKLKKNLSYYLKGRQLRYVNLSNNQITQNKPLSRVLKELRRLNLQYNNLINIGPIIPIFPNLQRLNLEGNTSFQCETLKASPELDLICPSSEQVFSKF